MLQYAYLYLTLAVIVIIGLGVVGIMLIRRGRRVADEDMFTPAAEDVRANAGQPESKAAAGPEGRPLPFLDSVSAPLPTSSPAPRAVSVPESGYLDGVEHLLAEWRAKHELAASHAASQEAAPAELAAAEPSVATSVESPAAAQARILVDPLGTVILDMLDGKGRLTGAELKRLEVFRPEKIDLSVQTVQLPLRLQGEEDVALRLAQIQLYAATLELRAKWAAQLPRPAAGAGDTPYSARDFRLKIARDIMDLPAPDRSEVIGFLLGGLLGSPGSSPELKRAVIDTLEHLRSASLVNVLLDCLDDPDPIVQEYALAAADRLLDG